MPPAIKMSCKPGKKALRIHRVLLGKKLGWEVSEMVHHGTTIPGSTGLEGRTHITWESLGAKGAREASHQWLGRRSQELTNGWGEGASEASTRVGTGWLGPR